VIDLGTWLRIRIGAILNYGVESIAYWHTHVRQKARKIVGFPSFLRGEDSRDRTDDLLNAIQTLSQLSYAPISIFTFDAISSSALH
jgi:hypothetical protein